MFQYLTKLLPHMSEKKYKFHSNQLCMKFIHKGQYKSTLCLEMLSHEII